MICITSLTTVGTEEEGVEVSSFPPGIERSHIGVEKVDVISIRRILLRGPLLRDGELPVESSLWLAFVVDAVEADDSLKEDVQFRMAARILGDFKKRLEYIPDHVLKVVESTLRFIQRIEPRYLNQPSNVV